MEAFSVSGTVLCRIPAAFPLVFTLYPLGTHPALQYQVLRVWPVILPEQFSCRFFSVLIPLSSMRSSSISLFLYYRTSVLHDVPVLGLFWHFLVLREKRQFENKPLFGRFQTHVSRDAFLWGHFLLENVFQKWKFS